jgi:MerR family mercuric resistance operon transcriptional regulator
MRQISDPRARPLAIGEVADRTGVNLETIRYYERAGLLPSPPRTAGGHRQYGKTHVKRLNFIRRARGLGFTIEEIRALLRFSDERQQPCAKARDLAAGHLEEIRTKISDLRSMEKVLREMVARCDNDTSQDCPLIEALFRERSFRPGSSNGSR